MLIPFLLRQKQLDLLLHTVELLFLGIRECRVGFQRKLAGVPDHGKLLIGKKVLLFYQTSSDSKIQLRGFVVLHVVMTGVNTLPVEVPLPRRCGLHIIRSDFSFFAQKSLLIHFVAAPLTAAIALLDCGGAFGK